MMQRSRRRPLLDHLVGGGEQRFWDGEAESLGGLEVDNEFKLGRLPYWQIRGLLSLENAAGIEPVLSPRARRGGAIAHKATSCSELAKLRDRRQSMPRG